MADITNEEAVRFCNEKARTLADLIEKTRRTAEQFAIDIVTEFEAHTSGNANGDTILGASTGGRSLLTKQHVLELKFVAEQAVAALTQDDREQLIANVSVNGQPIY